MRKEKIRQSNLEQLRHEAPQVVVYVSGLSNVAYQINQWLPVLERLTVKPLIVVRERIIAQKMNATEIPIFFARTMFDVETLYSTVRDSLRVVLYPANPMKNVQSLRQSELLHFFINHGESDKSVNQSKLLMAYDKLLVGGPLAEQRLRKAGLSLRDNQIEFVGRPQAEILLDQSSGIKKIKTLLYAPTWEGFVEDADYCSVSSIGLAMLNELVDCGEYQVLVKLHPYAGHRSREVRNALQAMKRMAQQHDAIEWLDSALPIHECMNRSDLMICDISSVLNEYLITRKPIIIMNTRVMPIADLEQQFPSARACYVLNPEKSILEILNGLDSKDVKQDDRALVRKQSLGDHPEGAMARFNQVIAQAVSIEIVERK
jgi:hypothetical protein